MGSASINGKKIISRKHIMMDARLKKLSNMNDNRNSQTESSNLTGGLMDKFWKQNVPIITEELMDNRSQLLQSLGKGTEHAISECIDESSY